MTYVKPTIRRRIHGVVFKLPGMISCQVFEDFVLAYLEEELSSTQRRVFEMHLKLCRECREYLEDYRKTLSATRNLSLAEKDTLAEVPEDLIKAILDARN